MEISDAIILGVIQGLTEFLPVSSSGHLELGKALLGSEGVIEQSLFFSVILHFATALSTIFVFRKDIYSIIKGLFQFKLNEETKLTGAIIISMIPAAVIGVLFEKQLDILFTGNILFVGSMLILTGILLLFVDKTRSIKKPITFKDAFIIGIAQAIAILPGISRSGATISTSVLIGNDKSKAARFSFLMVIPLIFGKIVKDVLSGEFHMNINNATSVSIGFVSAFISGLIACTWMISLVKKSKLTYFSLYCFVIGLVACIISFIK